MSDNTIVTLNWNKTHYLVEHIDVDTVIPFVSYKCKTLYEAVKKARHIQNTAYPEYGISIGSLKKEAK